jgi:hypothetical protein
MISKETILKALGEMPEQINVEALLQRIILLYFLHRNRW